MSTTLQPARTDVVVPEAPADARTVETHPAWLRLKAAATALQPLQVKDGSIPDPADHAAAREHVETIAKRIKSAVPSALDVSEDEGETDRWCEDAPFSVFATFTVEPDTTIGDMEDVVRPFFALMEKMTAPTAPEQDYVFGSAVLGK